MNCQAQHGNCGHFALYWVTKGGGSKKICKDHLADHLNMGWVRI